MSESAGIACPPAGEPNCCCCGRAAPEAATVPVLLLLLLRPLDVVRLRSEESRALLPLGNVGKHPF